MNDPRAAGVWIAALGDPDSGVRDAAVSALQQPKIRTHILSDADAFETLLRKLEDKNWEVRQSACKVLFKMNDPRATDVLIAALGDPNSNVRDDAVYELIDLLLSTHKLPTDNAIDPLLLKVRDKRAVVRRAACKVLGKIFDRRAADVLVTALLLQVR
jgi:HEAT repeat protein